MPERPEGVCSIDGKDESRDGGGWVRGQGGEPGTERCEGLPRPPKGDARVGNGWQYVKQGAPKR